MNWNKLVRKTHRSLAVTFAVLVVVNMVLNFAPAQEQLAVSVGILTLFPLALLLLTGLYLFVLPYITRRRGERRTAE